MIEVEHHLTETRELMLRYLTAEAGFPGKYPVKVNPLNYGMAQAQTWLIAHGYLCPMLQPTAKGLEAALELGSNHRVYVERVQVNKARRRAQAGRRLLQPVYGTRVRCSCGWGGWRRSDNGWITLPELPAEGGYSPAIRLHAEHCNEELD